MNTKQISTLCNIYLNSCLFFDHIPLQLRLIYLASQHSSPELSFFHSCKYKVLFGNFFTRFKSDYLNSLNKFQQPPLASALTATIQPNNNASCTLSKMIKQFKIFHYLLCFFTQRSNTIFLHLEFYLLLSLKLH